MRNFIFAISIIWSLVWPLALLANPQEPDFAEPLQTKASPVLVELFSSENCPACPPADKYMAELTKSNGIIALSCHVDYFGKTPANLGREFCTDRQTTYIKQIGRDSHFTPQMMINGHMSEIGYEKNKVSAKLVKGRSERITPISIQPKAGGVYNFTIQSTQIASQASLWLAVYDKPRMVNERGKFMTYHNVVKRFIPMGQWNGSALSRPVFPIIDETSAGFAIVAQDIRSGKVLAAGDFRL